jgi:hypothetical protein
MNAPEKMSSSRLFLMMTDMFAPLVAVRNAPVADGKGSMPDRPRRCKHFLSTGTAGCIQIQIC